MFMRWIHGRNRLVRHTGGPQCLHRPSRNMQRLQPFKLHQLISRKSLASCNTTEPWLLTELKSGNYDAANRKRGSFYGSTYLVLVWTRWYSPSAVSRNVGCG